MAKGDPKDPRGSAVVRSERATNSIIRSMEVLGRRGKGLSDKQKAAVLGAINETFEHTKKVLAGKATAKAGFTLEGEAAAPTK